MTLVGSSGGNPYPAGTTWVSSDGPVPAAGQIRRLVLAATAGVIALERIR
jgi:hypothetical protein